MEHSLNSVNRKGGMVRSNMMEVVTNLCIFTKSTKVLNIYIYEGSENPFQITRVYSTKWLCSYDMLFYPFDTQVTIFAL